MTLYDKDLLSSLIGYIDANKLANTIGSMRGVLLATEEDLTTAKISKRNIKKIHALQRISTIEYSKANKISSSKYAYEEVSHLRFEPVEHFVVLVMNKANDLLSCKTISIGGASGTVVDLKVVIKKILSVPRAASIIIAHNHPSENKQPSQQDIDITRKIKDACKLIDISLLDHIIVCGKTYYSFQDEGML